MILNEIIQSVQSLYSKGVHSNDTRLMNRHIYSSLVRGRSTIISQMSNKNQSLSSWFYQTLPCVELIEAPVSECVGVKTKSKILRSKEKIPTILMGLSDYLILGITNLDGSEVYNVTTYTTIKYNVGNKYTANKPNVYFKDGYVYIVGVTMLRALSITAIFDNPIDVWNFPSYCENSKCIDYYEEVFPIDAKSLKPILDIVNQELVSLFKEMEEDKSENASDDITPVKMVHNGQS